MLLFCEPGFEDFTMKGDVFYLVLVGALWGCTNPLIKIESTEITSIKGSNIFFTIVLQLMYFIINWKCLLPLVLNQCGSLVYFYTLQSSSLSLAVPAANSLAFIFTALTGWALGEKRPTKRSLIGIVLIVLGIICFIVNGSASV